MTENKSGISPRARLILHHIATTKPAEALDDLIYFSRADDNFVEAKHQARKNIEAVGELIRQGLVHLWVEDEWKPSPGGNEVELTDEIIEQMDADDETKEALRRGRDLGVIGNVEVVTNDEAFERARPRIVVREGGAATD